MRLLFAFITLPLSLPINPLWDYLLCLIIGEVAFQIAYSLAGEWGFSKETRKFIHWLVRIIVYTFVWMVFCGIIYIVKFVGANLLISLIIMGCLLVIASIFLIYKSLKNK